MTRVIDVEAHFDEDSATVLCCVVLHAVRGGDRLPVAGILRSTRSTPVHRVTAVPKFLFRCPGCALVASALGTAGTLRCCVLVRAEQ